jgi:hypothetical protein
MGRVHQKCQAQWQRAFEAQNMGIQLVASRARPRRIAAEWDSRERTLLAAV